VDKTEMKSNNNNNDDFTVLDNFEYYIQKTELFQQFQWSADYYINNKKGKDVLYNGRIYHINVFSGSDIGVTVTDMLTNICYSTNFGHQGLIQIITDQDREIFSLCTKLANNVREKIIKQAAQVKINEFKIITETEN
jgi:CYTH domain-containing protein